MYKNRIQTPDGTTTLTDELSRRGFLNAALIGAAGAATASAALAPGEAAAALGKGAAQVSVRTDGSYATMPLVKDSVRVGIVQSRVRPVDAANPAQMKKENLDHMLMLAENAQEWNPPSDILFFHEFPITGFRYDWSRKDVTRLAIETPGPETEALGALAKKYECYIVPVNDTIALRPRFCEAFAASINCSTAQACRAFGLPLTSAGANASKASS